MELLKNNGLDDLSDHDAFFDVFYDELEKLRRRISNVSREPTYGLHRKKQMPFFRMFRRELFDEDLAGEGGGRSKVVDPSPPYGWSEDKIISFLVDLTQKVFLVIERELRLTGFWQSIPAQNRGNTGSFLSRTSEDCVTWRNCFLESASQKG